MQSSYTHWLPGRGLKIVLDATRGSDKRTESADLIGTGRDPPPDRGGFRLCASFYLIKTCPGAADSIPLFNIFNFS